MVTEEFDDFSIPIVETNVFSTLESFERLVTYLSPRQSVIILLIDVFSFTARETAELTKLSEGAVKGILHRARKKLKSRLLLI
jgi:RNA polymerase sigma factor (sigma-70 family)